MTTLSYQALPDIEVAGPIQCFPSNLAVLRVGESYREARSLFRSSLCLHRVPMNTCTTKIKATCIHHVEMDSPTDQCFYVALRTTDGRATVVALATNGHVRKRLV